MLQLSTVATTIVPIIPISVAIPITFYLILNSMPLNSQSFELVFQPADFAPIAAVLSFAQVVTHMLDFPVEVV